MDIKTLILITGVAGLGGTVFGYFLRWIISLGKRGSMELKIKQMMLSAKEEAGKIIAQADTKAITTLEETQKKIREKELEVKQSQDRLVKKEELLDKRQTELFTQEGTVKKYIEEAKTTKAQIEEIQNTTSKKLEEVANFSEEEAKDLLIKEVEKKSEEVLLLRMKKLDMFGAEQLDRKAKEILTASIHRLGNSVASEVMATSIAIPSDDVKGKIIGKEGRNIRAFERIAGVDLIIDDTPGTITISAFDPVRRQIARVALENLIMDGRIQPAKIEDAIEKARSEINKIIKEKGEQAAYECGVYNLDPRIISILGRLYFRTSYGQNVLQHSIEMAHISAVLAEELGVDVGIAKAGALLHDIGKAVDHEVQGTHVEIGRRILEKFGADKRIIQAISAHHEEYPYETVESIIVQVADAISGGRPGARRDTVEHYLKRLGDLEGIATSFEGVERAHAIQAGREIRVFVVPEKISDINARKLAQDIARRIEQELKYPGEIKVNVIRESRIIEYAR
jgi:ribonuclease Y